MKTQNDYKNKGLNASECLIELKNSLTLNNVAEFKKEIEKKTTQYQSIRIVGKNIEMVDISGIQLLHSLKNWAQENKKKIYFEIKINSETEELLRKTGVLQIMKNQ